MLTNTREVGGHPEAEHEASPGRVFWITGLSGSGKTTLGREVWSRLRAAGRPVIFLDGDALRAAIAEDLGHSADNRRRSAMRNARLCRLLAEQGVDVVCATISLFHEVQRWNRENIPGYREIYLRVPIDELRCRDNKGIYAQGQRAEARDVVGIDVPAEAPEAPDLVLDNYGAPDIATAVAKIGPPRYPIGQQRIEGMTIDKNRIGKSQSDRFEYTACYLWQLLSARSMPDGGMAAVNHRCRTWMDADRIPNIFGPFSNVLQYQLIDIGTSGAEQSNNISCSVVPQMRDFPTPVFQMAPNPRSGCLQCQQFFARGFSRESDELVKHLHLPPLIQ
jgi:adenylylsulfate kinase